MANPYSMRHGEELHVRQPPRSTTHGENRPSARGPHLVNPQRIATFPLHSATPHTSNGQGPSPLALIWNPRTRQNISPDVNVPSARHKTQPIVEFHQWEDIKRHADEYNIYKINEYANSATDGYTVVPESYRLIGPGGRELRDALQHTQVLTKVKRDELKEVRWALRIWRKVCNDDEEKVVGFDMRYDCTENSKSLFGTLAFDA
jgi:hypothetical protein